MTRLHLFKRLIGILFTCFFFSQASLASHDIEQEAQAILSQLSMHEKIGQKLMLDFRTWEDKDLTELPPELVTILGRYAIGGVILFANNLENVAQITTLTHDFQKSMVVARRLPMFIGTDQEGGIVVRLPRHEAVTFPGNMALTAAYLGNPTAPYTATVGKLMAKNLKALGINLNFAPVVDVNVNPQNPVIHVRAFSDNPKLVTLLGSQFVQASQQVGIGTSLKHFPGHGDTNVDSHVGLPVVEHNLKDAWQIDLYPFQAIIQQNAPDLIMSAHIQFPALDNSLVLASKKQEYLVTPATLSRRILTGILRNKLSFSGLIITDAMNMAAISEQFDPSDATIKAFAAGADIVLMPVAITASTDEAELNQLYNNIEKAIQNGTLDRKELDASVLRIIKLKIKLGLLQPDKRSLAEKIAHAEKIVISDRQKSIEATLTDETITLVQNNDHTIPVRHTPHQQLFILMPWLEQAEGLVQEIKRLQREKRLPDDIEIQYHKMADTNFEMIKKDIEAADLVIVGNIATGSLPLPAEAKQNIIYHQQHLLGSLVFPDAPAADKDLEQTQSGMPLFYHQDVSDELFAYQTLKYAHALHKKTIFISLLAPYDLPNYQDVADAMLVGYDFYGYLPQEDGTGYHRGPSMQALVRIIFGIKPAKAKLPLNVPDPQDATKVIYPLGFGLSTS